MYFGLCEALKLDLFLVLRHGFVGIFASWKWSFVPCLHWTLSVMPLSDYIEEQVRPDCMQPASGLYSLRCYQCESLVSTHIKFLWPYSVPQWCLTYSLPFREYTQRHVNTKRLFCLHLLLISTLSAWFCVLILLPCVALLMCLQCAVYFSLYCMGK